MEISDKLTDILITLIKTGLVLLVGYFVIK